MLNEAGPAEKSKLRRLLYSRPLREKYQEKRMRSLLISVYSQFRRFSLRTHPLHVDGYPLFNLIYLAPYLHKGRALADFIAIFLLQIELTVYLDLHGVKIFLYSGLTLYSADTLSDIAS